MLVIGDGRILLGHATRFPRWDIPKGLLDPGENEEAAARRELLEETGLQAGSLLPLGQHAYLPDKDLCLFTWRPETMPDPAKLHCTSMVQRPGAAPFPEFDRFGVFPWEIALSLLGKSMARVLATLAHMVA